MKKNVLEVLNRLISNYELDGYIIPKNDSFFTEQVIYDRLKLVSNFSGSAGLAIVSKKINYLFVDNRYTIQAKLESRKNFKIIKIHKKLPLNRPKCIPGRSLASWLHPASFGHAFFTIFDAKMAPKITSKPEKCTTEAGKILIRSCWKYERALINRKM